MPDCQGVGESLISSKRAKNSTFAGFVPQSGITEVESLPLIASIDGPLRSRGRRRVIQKGAIRYNESSHRPAFKIVLVVTSELL